MSHIDIKQEESLSIKLTHLLESGSECQLDLFFFLPKEMGINPNSFDEEEYFHSGIIGRRSYYSDSFHIQLIQGKLIGYPEQTLDDFRLNLNLFTYQFTLAVENDTKKQLHLNEDELFYPAVFELAKLIKQTLTQFRLNDPNNKDWHSYFDIADNYLSWFCEQQLLKLISSRPRNTDYSQLCYEILAICREESSHRADKNYNSLKTKQDPNRISNKMLLLRRLLQRGVVLQEIHGELGVWLKKFSKGLAAALVMLLVSIFILKAKGVLSELTSIMLLALAVVYGFREIFKDDIRNAIWRYIRRGRPRWYRILKDTTDDKIIGKQLVWLDFLPKFDLPENVKTIFHRRHKQNRIDVDILHYGVKSRVEKDGFLTGYRMVQEEVVFSLVPFVRYLERGKVKIYQEAEGKVSYESAERRYQVNLVVALKERHDEIRYARYKITLNRSQIIAVSKSELPENIPEILMQKKKSSRSLTEYAKQILTPDSNTPVLVKLRKTPKLCE